MALSSCGRPISPHGLPVGRRTAAPPSELWPSYLAYAVTFLFIGQVWVNHHVMFDQIRAADRLVLLLNTLLLMVVAFLPFATSVLAEAPPSSSTASRSP